MSKKLKIEGEFICLSDLKKMFDLTIEKLKEDEDTTHVFIESNIGGIIEVSVKNYPIPDYRKP